MRAENHAQAPGARNSNNAIGRFTIIRADHCINCGQCAEACIYQVHERTQTDLRKMLDPRSQLCRNCFRCVYECPEHALTMKVSPEFEALRGITSPGVILSIWQQAETGRIPVTGQGYRGPFAGPGFDSIWTDMSEIVRPTRDGIHGREFISTAVDLGGAPERIEFDESGTPRLPARLPRQIEVPILVNRLPFGRRAEILRAVIKAAVSSGTIAILDEADLRHVDPSERGSVIIRRTAASGVERLVGEGYAGIELPVSEMSLAFASRTGASPGPLIALRTPLMPGAIAAADAAVAAGASIFHVEATIDGREWETGRHAVDALLELHRHLVSKALRDRISIDASGGIIAAEHIPKAIICGADAVAIDAALLAAAGSDLCERCREDAACSHSLVAVDRLTAASRMQNLLVAYHDQLLEILGAMGIREVRRLRGETGRAIFFDDAERELAAALARLPSPPSTAQNGSAPPIPPVAGRPGLPFHTIPHRWLVTRSQACAGCGICVAGCPYGVHEWKPGHRKPVNPVSHLCIGPGCESNDFFCVATCPEHALAVEEDPQWKALGDYRWTADLIVSTWRQAETGEPAGEALNEKTGDSGGGFDRMDFVVGGGAEKLHAGEISTALTLNRRRASPSITLPIPIYGGGMSYGSVGAQTMIARARAARAWSTFVSTGEGGYPEELYEFDDWMITQIATGLFGVREDTIQRVRIVEFKYAQGAKPGLGGHLLADKNSTRVAAMREAPPGTSLFSPFPFHSVYSVEDHKKHVDWIRATNPNCLVSVKVSTPSDVDMVAVGSYYAGADIIHLDGGYGGTGAAPDIAKKNIATPIEYAIPKVHQYLVAEGIRDEVVLMASGGIRTAWDVAKAIALGADGCVIGTAELVALTCNRCGNCESGQGCPSGIATTDPHLSRLIDPDWGANRIINMYHAWRKQWVELLAGLGLASFTALRGRTDLIRYLPAKER